MAGHVSGHVRLAKRKRGDVWYAKYRLPSGRQVQKKLGPHWAGRGRPPDGYFTRKLAEATLRELLVNAAHGEIPDEAPRRRRGPTFAEACDAWLTQRRSEKGVKPSTMRDYRNFAEAAKRTLGGETPLEAVDEDTMAAYKARRLGSVSRRTVQKEMVMLHGIFEVARKPPRRWIGENPCADIPKITVKASGDFNVLDPQQVYAVVEAAPGPEDRALLLVAALEGLRLGEIRALRWESVRFDLGSILVRSSYSDAAELEEAERDEAQRSTPKSGRVRTIPMMDDVAAALRGLRERPTFIDAGDLVFPSASGAYRRGDEIREMFYAALHDAGLGHLRNKPRPIRFHDLRHTFGTIAVRVFDVVEVQAFMGHENIQTTMRYVHYQPRHGAAQRFTEAVRQMAEADHESVGHRVPNRVPKRANLSETEDNSGGRSVPGEPQRIK
jgi:integrase